MKWTPGTVGPGQHSEGPWLQQPGYGDGEVRERQR